MTTDFISVTEIAGDEVTQEQADRLCNRYYWAGRYCSGKDVVEAACGPGQGLGYLGKRGTTLWEIMGKRGTTLNIQITQVPSWQPRSFTIFSPR